MLPTRRALRHGDEVVFTPRQEREAHEKLDKQTGAVRHAGHIGTVLRKRAHPNARGSPATQHFRTTTLYTVNVVSLVLVLAKPQTLCGLMMGACAPARAWEALGDQRCRCPVAQLLRLKEMDDQPFLSPLPIAMKLRCLQQKRKRRPGLHCSV